MCGHFGMETDETEVNLCSAHDKRRKVILRLNRGYRCRRHEKTESMAERHKIEREVAVRQNWRLEGVCKEAYGKRCLRSLMFQKEKEARLKAGGMHPSGRVGESRALKRQPKTQPPATMKKPGFAL